MKHHALRTALDRLLLKATFSCLRDEDPSTCVFMVHTVLETRNVGNIILSQHVNAVIAHLSLNCCQYLYVVKVMP